MKELLKRILRLLLSPLRAVQHRRNGVTDTAPRHELPNDGYLGLVSEYLRMGKGAKIYVKGYSMRPFLEHLRDQVQLVSPTDLHVGDAVLAEIAPGHYVLHRIIGIDGDRITLMGDGNVRGVEHCTRNHVYGVVTEYIRPHRTLLASDPRLCRRIRLWRRLLPIRRWLLIVYKATV